MTQSEKIGVAVIIGFFVALGFLLYLTLEPHSDTVRKPEDSVIIQQRMKNLQNSR